MKKKTEEFKRDATNYPLNNIPLDLWDQVRISARDIRRVSMRVYILEALREKLARDEAGKSDSLCHDCAPRREGGEG